MLDFDKVMAIISAHLGHEEHEHLVRYGCVEEIQKELLALRRQMIAERLVEEKWPDRPVEGPTKK